MADRFRQIFGEGSKPVIAMAHLGPLPGTPLYDEARGVQGIVDDVARDLGVLLQFPFDAVMFCNEGDRPYSMRAGFEGVAVMTRVVADLAPADRPFGVDFLWDGRGQVLEFRDQFGRPVGGTAGPGRPAAGARVGRRTE